MPRGAAFSHTVSYNDGMEWLLFVYAPGAERPDLLGDVDWQRIEWQLLQHPTARTVIPGLSGARKLRIRLPGRGSRSGARTIYLYLMARDVIYFLATYAKNEQTDLTPDDKKILRALIERIKQGRG